MDDDAHPAAMLSGLLLGMLLATALFAGRQAWHDAINDTCRITALESGRSPGLGCEPWVGLSDPYARI